MINPTLEKKILEQLDKLAIEQQQQVLNYICALADAEPVGAAGKELLYFSGSIEKSDLDIMTEAIEKDCEQVNLNEW